MVPPPSGGLDPLASIIRNYPHTEKADVPTIKHSVVTASLSKHVSLTHGEPYQEMAIELSHMLSSVLSMHLGERPFLAFD